MLGFYKLPNSGRRKPLDATEIKVAFPVSCADRVQLVKHAVEIIEKVY
jgi:hypothetical protein